MKYQTNDGLTFYADDEYQVIAKLRANSWNPEASFEAFSEQLAKRSQMQTGKFIEAYPPSALVNKLIELGLLKRED